MRGREGPYSLRKQSFELSFKGRMRKHAPVRPPPQAKVLGVGKNDGTCTLRIRRVQQSR